MARTVFHIPCRDGDSLFHGATSAFRGRRISSGHRILCWQNIRALPERDSGNPRPLGCVSLTCPLSRTLVMLPSSLVFYRAARVAGKPRLLCQSDHLHHRYFTWAWGSPRYPLLVSRRSPVFVLLFKPNMIYSFITLLCNMLKMAVPLVFGSTVFNVILSLLHIRLMTIHFLMLVMSDLMGLNLLFGTLGAGWRLV